MNTHEECIKNKKYIRIPTLGVVAGSEPSISTLVVECLTTVPPKSCKPCQKQILGYIQLIVIHPKYVFFYSHYHYQIFITKFNYLSNSLEVRTHKPETSIQF